jgi:hypothetical protein
MQSALPASIFVFRVRGRMTTARTVSGKRINTDSPKGIEYWKMLSEVINNNPVAAALAWEVPSECAGRNLDPYPPHVRARLRGRVFLNQ